MHLVPKSSPQGDCVQCSGIRNIETTGFNKIRCDLTLVGIAIEKDHQLEIVQPYGEAITAQGLLEALYSIDEIYTYNGSRFDLPFIKAKLQLDIKNDFKHTDLMYDCWKQNLKGGLKAVEQNLGIARNLKEIDGFMAVKLWSKYLNNNNQAALDTLLEYNKEDIVNLKILRETLNIE